MLFGHVIAPIFIIASRSCRLSWVKVIVTILPVTLGDGGTGLVYRLPGIW